MGDLNALSPIPEIVGGPEGPPLSAFWMKSPIWLNLLSSLIFDDSIRCREELARLLSVFRQGYRFSDLTFRMRSIVDL